MLTRLGHEASEFRDRDLGFLVLASYVADRDDRRDHATSQELQRQQPAESQFVPKNAVAAERQHHQVHGVRDGVGGDDEAPALIRYTLRRFDRGVGCVVPLTGALRFQRQRLDGDDAVHAFG